MNLRGESHGRDPKFCEKFLFRCLGYPLCMFHSESECVYLTSIHSVSSYDLKLIVADFLSGKMKRGVNWGSRFEGETNCY
jgi:hypothetical protein